MMTGMIVVSVVDHTLTNDGCWFSVEYANPSEGLDRELTVKLSSGKYYYDALPDEIKDTTPIEDSIRQYLKKNGWEEDEI